MFPGTEKNHEIHYISARKPSRLMLHKIWSSNSFSIVCACYLALDQVLFSAYTVAQQWSFFLHLNYWCQTLYCNGTNRAASPSHVCATSQQTAAVPYKYLYPCLLHPVFRQHSNTFSGNAAETQVAIILTKESQLLSYSQSGKKKPSKGKPHFGGWGKPCYALIG